MKRISPLTLRYAKAIFEMALAEKSYQQLYEEICSFKEILFSNTELKNVLFNATLPPSVRLDCLASIMSRLGYMSLTKRVLEFLLKKKRLIILGELPTALEVLINEYHGIVQVEVISAFPVSEDTKRNWLERFQKILNKKVELFVKEDRTQLGGIEVRIGDRSLDGTCRGKLEKLRYLLLTA